MVVAALRAEQLGDVETVARLAREPESRRQRLPTGFRTAIREQQLAERAQCAAFEAAVADFAMTALRVFQMCFRRLEFAERHVVFGYQPERDSLAAPIADVALNSHGVAVEHNCLAMLALFGMDDAEVRQRDRLLLQAAALAVHGQRALVGVARFRQIPL